MTLKDLLNKYENLWMPRNLSYPTERESVKKLGSWRTSKTQVPFNPNIIPEIEISNHYNPDTILFVGMNSSGADIDYYYAKNKTHDSVFIYEGNSQYYKTMQKFADYCYAPKNKDFAALDIFGIVQAEQKIIEKDFKDHPNNYKEMFALFLEAIDDLKPEVIVVANAFVRKILLQEKPFNGVKFYTFYNGYQKPVKNTNFGGYDLVINSNKYHVYFSCMLSGGHLDSGNRENLIWLIRNFFKNGHVQKTRNVQPACPPSLP